MLYIGPLTTDKSGPAFECPAALKAAVKLQLPILWGKLWCCLNFFSFPVEREKTGKSKLLRVLLRSEKFSCFIALDVLKMQQQVPTSLRISREISHKLKQIESYLAVFPLSTLCSFKCCLDIN